MAHGTARHVLATAVCLSLSILVPLRSPADDDRLRSTVLQGQPAAQCVWPQVLVLLVCGWAWVALASAQTSAGPAPGGVAGESAPPDSVPARREPVFEIRGFEVEGAKLLAPQQLSALLAPMAGPGKRFSDIEAALDAVIEAYERAGITAVRVTIPEQTLADGRVRLQVEELRLARVAIEGASMRQPGNLRRAVPALLEGSTPVDTVLSRELRLANENPARRMEVTFRTEDDDTLTAVLRVADRPPLAGQLSLDNTGTGPTGRWRLGVALQHANLLDRDIVATAQAQTSPGHTRDVQVGALNLRLPWYAAGLAVDASASASSVDSGTVRTLAGDYTLSSRGRNAGLRLTRLLPRWGAADQRLSLGIDWRHVDARVLVGGGGSSLVPDVVLRPLSLAYALQGESQGLQWQWQWSIARNLPGAGRSAAAVFAEPGLRAGAEPRYTVVRSGLSFSAPVGPLRAQLGWSEQWTADALLPAEQFGIGGEGSVRGFDGRLAAGDRGRRLGVELQGPLPSPAKGVAWRLGWQVFADAGQVKRVRVQPGESARVALAGAGLGLRLEAEGRLSARADAGRVLRGDGLADAGSSFVHVNVNYGF